MELTAELTADAQTVRVRHSLRSGDAVQLASCLYLQRETGERISFAAFDDRLATAAHVEGDHVCHLGELSHRSGLSRLRTQGLSQYTSRSRPTTTCPEYFEMISLRSTSGLDR